MSGVSRHIRCRACACRIARFTADRLRLSLVAGARLVSHDPATGAKGIACPACGAVRVVERLGVFLP